jgi:hypothetical protein
MTTRDLDYLHFVRRHFNDLQGLRTGLGTGLVLIGLALAPLGPLRPLLILLAFACVVVGGLLAGRLGRRYYQRRFGEVERLPAASGTELSSAPVQGPAAPAPWVAARRPVNPRSQWFLAAVITAYALVVAVLSVGSQHSVMWSPGPILALGSYLAVGVGFIGVWLWRERRFSQSYYLVLGVLLLGLVAIGVCLRSVLPVLQDLGLARFLLPLLASFSLAQILCGTLLIFVGLLDHWQLMRVLKPAR